METDSGVDQDAVGKLVIRLERAVEALKETTAHQVANIQKAQARCDQKLSELETRFGEIHDDRVKERAEWREKGRSLDDAMLQAGRDHRKTREEIDAMRKQLGLIRLPDDVVKPLKEAIGKLSVRLDGAMESDKSRDSKLRAELSTYVPLFRNRGRAEEHKESTYTPIADQKAAEEAAGPQGKGKKFKRS